jgi:NADPH:quinone reductase-like Zn-dependent oxidoreductase
MNRHPTRITLTLARAALCAAAALGGLLAAFAAPLPSEQSAIVQIGAGGPEVLQLQSIPVPHPGPGQVLIRVAAASVNPADYSQLARMPTESDRRVPGLDVAGVVVADGVGVSDPRPGTAVFAIVDSRGLNGGFTHYAVANVATTALKPRNFTFAQAAGLGVVGVTAARVVDEGQIHAGKRVLILGVAGGVGSSIAQIAVARGATVLGTASPRHAAYLHSIGVSRVINYTAGNVASRAGHVDVVIDTVGGDEALQSLAALGPGGLFVSIARARVTAEQCSERRIQCLGSPGSAAQAPAAVIRQVAQLAGDGNLRVHVDRTYPLARAAEAVRYNHAGHTEGKVILLVSPAAKG